MRYQAIGSKVSVLTIPAISTNTPILLVKSVKHLHLFPMLSLTVTVTGSCCSSTSSPCSGSCPFCNPAPKSCSPPAAAGPGIQPPASCPAPPAAQPAPASGQAAPAKYAAAACPLQCQCSSLRPCGLLLWTPNSKSGISGPDHAFNFAIRVWF